MQQLYWKKEPWRRGGLRDKFRSISVGDEICSSREVVVVECKVSVAVANAGFASMPGIPLLVPTANFQISVQNLHPDSFHGQYTCTVQDLLTIPANVEYPFGPAHCLLGDPAVF